MSRLNLRTFTVSLVLVSASIGLALGFTEGVVSQSDASFDEDDELHQIRDGFGEEADNIAGDQARNETAGIDIQTDFFFLSQVWNVITAVPQGLSDVTGLIQAAGNLTGLNIPDEVYGLISIVFVAVIFAVLSAARGWDV